MHTEVLKKLNNQQLEIWKHFLTDSSLEADYDVEETVLIWDDDILIGTGSRSGNILKCIAVSKQRQGEGLTATIITALRQRAFSEGHSHLFLYTKPENKDMFSSLFFYPVAQSDSVLLMENKQNGISDFINSIAPKNRTVNSGAIIMNCNPFTLGHRFLIETASKDCDTLYIFVVSEDKSMFSANDRLNMVKAGTEDLKNVIVLPTGPYLVSSATFPTYFLKNRDDTDEVKCLLDIEIFTKYFAPAFNISKRYVGTEPLSYTTNKYNISLKEHLPCHGIELTEIPRLEIENNVISATKARELILHEKFEELKKVVPKSTIDYLTNNNLL